MPSRHRLRIGRGGRHLAGAVALALALAAPLATAAGAQETPPSEETGTAVPGSAPPSPADVEATEPPDAAAPPADPSAVPPPAPGPVEGDLAAEEEDPAAAEAEAAAEEAEAQEVLEDPDATPEEIEAAAQRRAAAIARRAAAREAAKPLHPILFDLKFPEEKGGGSATGSTGSLEYQREDLAVLSQGMEVRYQDMHLKAESATVDLAAKTVVAEGNVIIDQGPRRLTGDRATFDLETKTGSLTNAKAFVEPDYFFTGALIEKTGEDTYHVEDGVFTSCKNEVPDWSFRIAEGKVEVGGYARVQHASMRIKRLPVLYTPYILWPVREERSSGFLIPNIGYSARRGAYLGLAYFKTLGDSYDTTFFFDAYSREYWGIGNEFRYHPTDGTEGNFRGYAVDDPETGEVRWKTRWDHRTNDLWNGMRAVVSYRDYSDFQFFQDFERDFDLNAARFNYSNAFLSGSWGTHSLNVLLDSRETFIGLRTESDPRVIRQSQLPEIEYRMRAHRLGRSPFYLDLRSSATYFSVERSERYQGEYGRVDFFPQIRVPVRPVPWLSLSTTVGGRGTWYGKTLAAGALDGESYTRTLPIGTTELIGPSFSRIFDREIGRFGRFKHVIEPRISYSYQGDIEDEDLFAVPISDEVDIVQSQNLGRVSLINRVLGKPIEVEGRPSQGAREILQLEISRNYSFDAEQPLQRSRTGEETSSAGPILTSLRLAPSDRFNLQARIGYDTLYGAVDNTSLSARYGAGLSSLGVTWFTRTDPERDVTVSDQVRIFGGLPLLDRKLRIQTQLAYDIELGLLQQQRYMLDYNSQCYSLRLELRDFRAGDRRDRDYRFAITLKNVGTFLDLTGGDSGGAADPTF